MRPSSAGFPTRLALLSAFFGMLMAVLPYLCWYAVAHSTLWIENVDEVWYALLVSHAYYWHPFYLSDPTFLHGGQAAYSWLQLVPAELVAKALGLAPIRFDLILRLFGGLAIGFGWYAVIWQHLRRCWATFLGALFLLTDSGWLQLRPFLRQASLLAEVLLHRATEIFAGNPAIHREWRIISPIAVLPFLLLYLFALRRSIDEPSRRTLLCSGLAFGLLFYAYLYYWTAAGLALLLGIIFDRARWRTYFHTGWIGVVAGIPELAIMLFASHGHGSDWMLRVDEFLPIPRLSEHGHFLLSLALVVLTFFLTWRFVPKLMYLWCLCAAGFLLLHQQLVTGLQMQNWHWAYVFCSCMTLLLILLVLRALDKLGPPGRLAQKVLAVAVIVNAAAGVYLRGAEAVRSSESLRYTAAYADYLCQHGQSGYRPLDAGAVTAGNEQFVQFAMITDHVLPLAAEYPVVWSVDVSDADFDRRIALNAYLSGESREQFAAAQEQVLNNLQFGMELRHPELRAPRLARRLEYFDQVSSNPATWLEEFNVRYLAMPANAPRPATLGPGWDLIETGSSWQVWERTGSAKRMVD